ncbi:MAG: NADH:flavin oxidoreductase [Novosphingobium meiothermophilum]|uniref:NADH:flavin oxidoreductase n=1 Tax=Novosphingobium TaxID=165696 RepID=UPI000D6E79FC|nr:MULTISPECIES: NADH:flavin oxidoreductase [Novosphingobium]
MSLLDPFFTPFECKTLKLANRFLMAPMSRYFAPGGVLTQESVDYYRRRIEGGVGGVITEAVAIDRPGSVAADTVPSFYGEEALAAWDRARIDVQGAGGAIIPQLWHVGGCTDFNFPDSPHPPLESPSGLVGPGIEGGRVMTAQDVDEVIASFVRGALDAQRLGFDAIELHGAHGYLFDQFFWDVTNKREDSYGGSDIASRVRFAAETVAAIRAAAGPDFTIIFRVSQWKTYMYEAKIATTPAELEQWLAPLADAGVDIFHCSERRFWEAAFPDEDDRNLAGWTKRIIGKPTITVGSVGLDRDLMQDFVEGQSVPTLKSLDELARRFDRGDFDLVALGRVLLADPNWLTKVRSGATDQLKPYSRECMDTLY